MKQKWILTVLTIVALSPCVRADGLEYFAKPVDASANSFAIPAPRADDFTVVLKPYCFGVNLRNQSNPLSPTATVEMSLQLSTLSAPVTVKFLGSYVQMEGRMAGSGHGHMDDPAKIANYIAAYKSQLGINATASDVTTGLKLPSSTNATAVGNEGTIVMRVPGAGTVSKISNSGDISVTPVTIQSIGFVQSGVVTTGSFLAQNGPLSGAWVHHLSSDGKTLDIVAGFPGQEGWCGGFHSPLMMFFSKAMPKFTGESDFPLDGVKRYTHSWPEKGAPGYFLVRENENPSKGSPKYALFGQQDGKKNGFEVLSAFDSNHDGKIDAADADFSKLRLWQNRKGDGIQHADEIVSLASMGVESIDLKFVPNEVTPLGDRAEKREYSTFVYRDKSGAVKKGDIIDIWFSNH